MKINKILVSGVIVLFLAMTTVSAVNVSNSISPLNKGDPPVPHLEGVLGENDWYISGVVITFDYDPGFVDEIQYYLNGNWHEYNENGIHINDDGEYSIPWRWVDKYGQSYDEWPIGVMIDQTGPTIQISKKVGTDDKITFTATCNDPVSGIDIVEFYVDDVLVDTINAGPYQYVWDGIGIHTVHAVGYNNAGLSKESNSLDTTHRSRVYNYPFLNSLLEKIYQIINWIQKLTIT